MRISSIVAFDDNFLIGRENALPWHIPEDMKWFKEVTTGSIVVMGRRTWEAHPKLLPNRTNIIISKTIDKSTLPDGAIVMESLIDAFIYAGLRGEDIYVIGGYGLYLESLDYVDKLYISHVKGSFKGDTYFPKVNVRSDWMRISRKRYKTHDSCIYVRKTAPGKICLK